MYDLLFRTTIVADQVALEGRYVITDLYVVPCIAYREWDVSV